MFVKYLNLGLGKFLFISLTIGQLFSLSQSVAQIPNSAPKFSEISKDGRQNQKLDQNSKQLNPRTISGLKKLYEDVNPVETGFKEKLRKLEMGTKDGGGGHPIEADFRFKSETIINELLNMSSVAKMAFSPMLKPDILKANLSVPMKVQPLCAEEGHELDFMFQKQKLAYVGAPFVGPNVILLNCSEKVLPFWAGLFVSQSAGSKIFFTHELVRNNDISLEAENSYNISGTIIEAERINNEYSVKLLTHLLMAGKREAANKYDIDYKAHNCIITLKSYNFELLEVYLIIPNLSKDGGMVVFKDSIRWPSDHNQFVSSLLGNSNSSDIKNMRTELLRTAATFKCSFP